MTGSTHRIRIRKDNVEIEVEGERQFVEDKTNELLKSFFDRHEHHRIEKEGITDKTTPQNKQDLLEFFRLKSPEDHSERVLVFIYWLEKMRTPLIVEPSNSDIEDCFDLVSISKPGRIRSVTYKLTKKKPPLLLKGKSNSTHRLSMQGQEYVEHQLPASSKSP